jgi:hypothetical protein
MERIKDGINGKGLKWEKKKGKARKARKKGQDRKIRKNTTT